MVTSSETSAPDDDNDWTLTFVVSGREKGSSSFILYTPRRGQASTFHLIHHHPNSHHFFPPPPFLPFNSFMMSDSGDAFFLCLLCFCSFLSPATMPSFYQTHLLGEGEQTFCRGCYHHHHHQIHFFTYHHFISIGDGAGRNKVVG